ncbi:MAG: aspartyl/glutamyl-tRNA amidotransferase subunit A [Candidatus Kerfeldbacteria bacterium RIFCSPHIGHO2_02_FULL_42_14]|uniref:Glutamyl-tRNA(Gln) amidotransferase subunit A n=1 Tax=Candidatus Kerfeldbacteria bacterium RIFCSPHIGHO2_02_FULL_42_14 TaxID=1798540 RepID=A0A1G2ARX4_9BACT|nr:MAG: aspartyl/glutamyl-tRNA amidotransferase subunit A [Candidatus Kerfeldbacteria bacterium RIFCSPHIGHO2_02_FULL_42_14]OGY80450.1 MAG: aspartyl/glutamyl-tRNA amidotransferase subunit A [Candidatus Kerfeldbacteria bacterium RIFCSPHIGHO2_12_FULL_42_13]OGY83880.1 MAG: aspartyl/glutamyl-tRNA amidotransferase subunit A [Candidatus Kerfeldbacteria bacterium RIFCSPLOWO2_02_FULL_42_19]OGY86581.1 MAG: aspartyl/glutamyl-tRNA amidotransferase subunit A [Candidatus Kerfeldbacteria bacterium RIFCSPLOWO2_
MMRVLHEKLTKGEISARELTQKYLDAINMQDSDLHAFLYVNVEGALEQAEKADAIIKRGEATLITGIPFAVKDNFCVQGMPTTAGSQILENYIPPYTATAVQRLLDQGAVLLGKTNMDEFAMGASTEQSAFGPTKNVHDTTRVPGGSSGGSATAVAAGESVFALGTDTGGSIRQPAGFSGVVGLKVSYGRVSRYGVIALASSVDVIGPITNTVDDAAIVFEAMAGRDPYDSTTSPHPVPKASSIQTMNLKGITVGIPQEYFETEGIEEAVKVSVEAAIEALKNFGARIQSVRLPHTAYAIPTYYIIIPSEASSNLARYDGIRFGYSAKAARDISEVYNMSRSQGFGVEPRRRVLLGTFVLSEGYHDAYYKQAQKVRTLIRMDFEKAFRKVDALITPTSPNVAFPLHTKDQDPLAMYLQDVFTAPANLAGICALSIPVKNLKGTLPVGMQIMGPAYAEEKILRIASTYECVRAKYRKG